MTFLKRLLREPGKVIAHTADGRPVAFSDEFRQSLDSEFKDIAENLLKHDRKLNAPMMTATEVLRRQEASRTEARNISLSDYPQLFGGLPLGFFRNEHEMENIRLRRQVAELQRDVMAAYGERSKQRMIAAEESGKLQREIEHLKKCVLANESDAAGYRNIRNGFGIEDGRVGAFISKMKEELSDLRGYASSVRDIKAVLDVPFLRNICGTIAKVEKTIEVNQHYERVLRMICQGEEEDYPGSLASPSQLRKMAREGLSWPK